MFIAPEEHAGLIRYELYPGEPLDRFSLDVLSQNPPEGVLRLGRETTEDHDHLLLPVAGLLPLSEAVPILKGKDSLYNLLEEVDAVREALPKHMIPPGALLLRPEFTFLDPESGAVRLCCLPVPAAADLSLSRSDYEVLVRERFRLSAQETEEKAPKRAARGRESKNARKPEKTWRERAKVFWESLD